MKRITRLIFTVLAVMMCLSFAACDLSTLFPPVIKEITDSQIVADITKFNFNYYPFEVVPGMDPPPIGDDYDKTWGAYYDDYVGVRDEYVYLVEYGQVQDGYYLVYLDKSLIHAYKQYYEENQAPAHVYGNFLSRNENFIDGKYLFAHQNIANGTLDDVKVVWVADLKDAAFTYKEDYQLVFCAQAKEVVVKENLSQKTQINNSLILYARRTLGAVEGDYQPVECELPNLSYVAKHSVEYWFAHEGVLIESLKHTCETDTAGYLPRRTKPILANYTDYWIVAELNGQHVVVIQRYNITDKGTIDWLDVNESTGRYGDEATAFADAFIRMAQSDEFVGPCGPAVATMFGVFDYDKIVSIIR